LSEMTYALTMLGRWDEALARFAELPDEKLGTNTELVGLLTGVLELLVHRGQLSDARELLDRYTELIARSADIQVQSGYQAGIAAVRLAERKHREALTAAEEAFA